MKPESFGTVLDSLAAVKNYIAQSFTVLDSFLKILDSTFASMDSKRLLQNESKSFARYADMSILMCLLFFCAFLKKGLNFCRFRDLNSERGFENDRKSEETN